MLSFKDFSKVLIKMSKITKDMEEVDKMTKGELSKNMDNKESDNNESDEPKQNTSSQEIKIGSHQSTPEKVSKYISKQSRS